MKSQFFKILLALGISLLLARPTSAARRYVNANVIGGANNGLDWPNAYMNLQSALADPSATEIWVAAGVYTPGPSRFDTFLLRNGVAIHGGFGGTESELAERDPGAGPSILSGDIGTPNNSSDNSYHVVTGSGRDATAILEGFTIAWGAADLASLKRYGGGLLIEGASSSPTIINCTFLHNTARNAGGGLYNLEGAPTLVNCVFRNNTTTGSGVGAAVFTDRGRARFFNCTIIDNVAGGQAGGVFTYAYSGAGCPDNAEFINCIFHHNRDGDADGNLDHMDEFAQISADLTFCPPELRAVPNPFVLAYSCIQGWGGTLGGPGNFAADPLFIDAAGRLAPVSPCVNAGSNAALPSDALDLDSDANTAEIIARDVGGGARIVDGTVDVGAYEARLDCNSNGVVDALDIVAGTSSDCNANAFPDECDTLVRDCNANATPDVCDIAGGTSIDCNANGVPDLCDIAAATSGDCNANAFPDDCEMAFRFFVLDNGDADAVSQIQAFDLATGAAVAPTIAQLPAAGSDRGMTVLPGAGKLLTSDLAGARLHVIDAYLAEVTATHLVDRPLLELAYDWDNQILYATTPGGLFRLDLSFDPVLTVFIAELPGSSPDDWVALAYDPRTGLLVGGSQTEKRLHYLDPLTGEAVPARGAFGVGLADLAVDPASGVIFGVTEGGTIHTVDRVTGQASAALLQVAEVNHTAAGLAVSTATDCNGNGLLDACELAAGTGDDCNANAVPDACEPDCNLNAVPDACEPVGGGDFDADSDIDLVDAAAMVDCLAGPNRVPGPQATDCAPLCLIAFDLDADHDVDVWDYAAFNRLITN